MGKKENIVKEKCQKSIPKYTGSIQRLSIGATKKTEKDNKKQPPQPRPNQSTKSTVE